MDGLSKQPTDVYVCVVCWAGADGRSYLGIPFQKRNANGGCGVEQQQQESAWLRRRRQRRRLSFKALSRHATISRSESQSILDNDRDRDRECEFISLPDGLFGLAMGITGSR